MCAVFIHFIKPGLRFLYINVHVDTSDIMVEELVEPTNGKCMWSTLGVFNVFLWIVFNCDNKMCFMFGITNYKL